MDSTGTIFTYLGSSHLLAGFRVLWANNYIEFQSFGVPRELFPRFTYHDLQNCLRNFLRIICYTHCWLEISFLVRKDIRAAWAFRQFAVESPILRVFWAWEDRWCDSLLSLAAMPFELYWLWRQYPWVFGDAVCDAKMLTTETVTYSSILTILAFTVERYSMQLKKGLWLN